ncbi:MAG: PAS domain S-box protein [Deltaproteobacteria bacterium]|nr:PAS domain S-box protein [Deltaproteobacteria bacterium]
MKATLFAETLRTIPLAAAVFDREMRYVAHNRRWLSAHGSDEGQDLAGRGYYEVHPQVPEEWRRIHQACLAGDSARRELDPFERADGRVEWFRWAVSPWGEAAGRVDGIIVYVETVTEQIQTKRRLAERESLIRDLFDHSPIGLNLCRMDGLWLESNQAFCDIIGYSREEADGGLTYWQLTPRQYDAQEAEQLERLRSTRRYGPYEKEFIRKDGRLVPVRLNGFLVEREGQTYIWSLIEDLTAQRALEAIVDQERLKAIQASKLATVGEMAAGIAHEINNPLGIIDAYAFALDDARRRGDEAQVNEAVSAIRGAVARAAKIVHGLRKFTRQAKRDEPENVEISALVEEAINLTSSRFRDEGVELSVEVTTRARVRGHSIELGQVLVNLLNNAVDAVRSASPRWVRVSATDAADDRVLIEVKDSGPGIPKELRGEVFRAFFTTKKVGEGTGLGLSISRTIMESHGGSLTYDETAPSTCFVMSLPRLVP